MDYNWINIQDRSRFLEKIKQIHPDDPRYVSYWKNEKRKVIEGYWVYDNNGWRFMPPKLYFTVNHGTMLVTDHEEKSRKLARPFLTTLFWEFGYISLESDGFSGFIDSNITCNKKVLELKNNWSAVNSKKHINLFKKDGTFKEYCEPREFMRILHTEPLGRPLYENSTENYIILGARGTGKALAHGSIIKTPKGDIKIEDVKVGNYVFGKDGKQTKVTGVFPQGKVPLYEITFRTGRKVTCCENHLWSCYNWGRDGLKITDTKSMFLDYKQPRKITKHNTKGLEFKYAIPMNDAVEYSTKEYEIDPYLLGVLLGDGHISNKYTNKLITITTHKTDLHHYLNNIILPEGVKFRIQEKKGTDNYSIHIGHTLSEAQKRIRNKTHIYNTIEKLNLSNKYSYEKRIPEQYMYGDSNQRLRLLQGLMDTDGYVQTRKRKYTCTSDTMFTVANAELAQDVATLARSLGISTQVSEHYNNGYKGYTNVTFYTNRKDLFLLQRKKDAVVERTTKRQLSRFDRDMIVNIKKVEDDYATCIVVDNKDKLFLTNDFIVTHNSYWLANAELAYPILTDGAMQYDEQSILHPNKTMVLLGSSDVSKSGELAAKVSDVFNTLGIDPMLGVYSEFGKDDYMPSPLYKDMVGDISANNSLNPFRHEYKVRVNGRELLKGTQSQVHHVVFSEMKSNKKGAQAAAGKRLKTLVWDEVGLSELVRDAHKSNEATIMTDGIRYGKLVYAGTSENMQAIQPTKEMFTHPKDYRLLQYNDNYENSGSIGFFIPAEIVLIDAMDEHGNVDLEKAKTLLNKEEGEKSKASNPDILRGWKMNYPRKPSDMWAFGLSKLLPYEEAALREKELMSNNLYHKIGKSVKLTWDTNSTNGVKYEIDYEAQPIFTYPITNQTNVEGAIVIYDFPQFVNGNIPNDMYIYTHDPYIADSYDEGGSLGCTHIWLNPKYWSEYLIGSPLVATYLGKAKNGKKQYYENQEKLIQLFGNCHQMLYYEANRGEDCYYHYLAKGKLNLLAPRPSSSDSMFQETVRKFGFTVSNKTEKLNMISSFADLLLSKIKLDKFTDNERTFISTIPDIYLIREIMAYNLEDNFDAVSCSLGYPIAIREIEKSTKTELVNKINKNQLAFLSCNSKMFKINDYENNRRFLKESPDWYEQSRKHS